MMMETDEFVFIVSYKRELHFNVSYLVNENVLGKNYVYPHFFHNHFTLLCYIIQSLFCLIFNSLQIIVFIHSFYVLLNLGKQIFVCFAELSFIIIRYVVPLAQSKIRCQGCDTDLEVYLNALCLQGLYAHQFRLKKIKNSTWGKNELQQNFSVNAITFCCH